MTIEDLKSKNKKYQDDLSQKENEVLRLIQEKQELNYQLREDLDAKSEYKRNVRANLDSKMSVLEETLALLEKKNK